jgi:Zn finger protein HypA/HybF involved in hydrogenase expression
MEEKPNCRNCEESLVKTKHGYHCPNCHSLYAKDMSMVWDGAKYGKNKGNTVFH